MGGKYQRGNISLASNISGGKWESTFHFLKVVGFFFHKSSITFFGEDQREKSIPTELSYPTY